MKKLSIILVLAITAIISSCNGVKREPGSIYMPDMAYSRAYESYADHSNLTEKGINYTAMPVAGTLARGAGRDGGDTRDIRPAGGHACTFGQEPSGAGRHELDPVAHGFPAPFSRNGSRQGRQLDRAGRSRCHVFTAGRAAAFRRQVFLHEAAGAASPHRPHGRVAGGRTGGPLSRDAG